MKAVIARRGSVDPEFADVASPTPGPDEVRVAVTAAAFTYFDAFVAGHVAEFGLPDQIGLGFDFSGTVVEIGSAVSALTVGDRVAGLHANIAAAARAHADEVVLPASALAVVPESLDSATAAATPLSALTARQALDLLGAERGTLLITGAAGAIGGWLAELAHRDGWSVTTLVRPGTESLVKVGAIVTEPGRGFDAVVDAAALYQPAMSAVRDNGRYVGFKPGQPQPEERGVTVSTVQVRADGEALTRLLPIAADGTVDVRIAGSAPLSDAANAYRQAADESGSRGRWLLVP